MGAAALWTAVVASYDNEGLISLTNVNDPSATSVNTTKGENAAQAVIDLWPAYAQAEYDLNNMLHVEVAKRATIAMLWHRGGTSTNIAKVEFDSVFSDEGLLSKVRRTGPRGRTVPRTNSGVSTRREDADGRRVRGWSDPDSLPSGILPKQVIAED